MDPKTKLLSETYRLFNPYHDKIGRFATKAGGVAGGAVREALGLKGSAAAERRGRLKEAAKKGGVKGAAKSFVKEMAGGKGSVSYERALKAKAKRKQIIGKAGKWMKENPEWVATGIVTAVGVGALIAGKRFERNLETAVAKSKGIDPKLYHDWRKAAGGRYGL